MAYQPGISLTAASLIVFFALMSFAAAISFGICLMNSQRERKFLREENDRLKRNYEANLDALVRAQHNMRMDKLLERAKGDISSIVSELRGTADQAVSEIDQLKHN